MDILENILKERCFWYIKELFGMIGYVYKLECVAVDVNEIYVGSTKNMVRRKCLHKSCCNNPNGTKYNLRVYQYIREHGGFENWRIVQIEQVGYETKPELRAREQFHLKNLGASLNMIIPNRTQAEYRVDNKESIAVKTKAYQESNKERIAEYRAAYRESNREIIAVKQKAYDETHKEQKAEYAAEYRETHKVKASVKHDCECGGKYTHGAKSRHFKTVKHRTHETSQSTVAE